MKVKHTSLVLLCALLLVSCKKDTDKNEEENNTKTKTVVYTAGVGSPGENNIAARYWKNGEMVALSNNTNETRVNGIFVNNGDVYVAGEERNDRSNFVPKYWKNGVAVELTDGNISGVAQDILYNKGDVYVVGAQFEKIGSNTVSVATYWKNGTSFSLSEKNSIHDAIAMKIVIDGDDVYIVGFERNGAYNVAKYWKNGVVVELSDGNNNAEANGIVVINGDVHVGGHEVINDIAVPTYWLNGKPTRLANPGVGYWSNGLAVSGKDAYIAIRENGGSVEVPHKIGYWKVGNSTVELTNGVNKGSVYGIAVDGKDIYVVGDYKFDGKPASACIWKNGEITKLPTGGSNYSEANAIFLAKEPIK